MKARFFISEISKEYLAIFALILLIVPVSSPGESLESSDASAWLLISPGNGSIIPPVPVRFDWNVISGTFYYKLQVATTVDFIDRTIVLDLKIPYATEYTTYDLLPGNIYHWRIRSVDYNNNPLNDWCPPWSFTTLIPTDIQDENETNLPEKLSLEQNYPNPFNPTTTINFYLPRAEYVDLTIYDLLGRKVTTLLDTELSYGSQSINWDGTDKNGEPVAGGIYLYRLRAGDYSESKKMLLLK
jgi:hypothetical protein